MWKAEQSRINVDKDVLMTVNKMLSVKDLFQWCFLFKWKVKQLVKKVFTADWFQKQSFWACIDIWQSENCSDTHWD